MQPASLRENFRRFGRQNDRFFVISRRFLLTFGPLLGACGRPGAGFRGHAYVACAGSDLLAVVDLLAFNVRERIGLSGSPSSLFRLENRLFALIPGHNAVDEIDTAQRRRVFTHRLPGAPLAVRAEAGNHNRLWALVNEPEPALYALALNGERPPRRIALAGTATGAAFAPYEPLAAAMLETGEVQFAALDQGRAYQPAALGPGHGEGRFRSDGRLLMVAGRERRRLSFLDPASRRIVVELPLPLAPEHFYVNPDGGQAFLTGEGRDAVVIVYPYRTEIAQTSLSGRRPGKMAASVEPPYLFVSNPEANSVSVFDIQTQKVVAVTGAGVRPGAIGITPDQQYALVLNEVSGDVAVIRIASITPGRAKRAPLFTMIPAGDRPVDLRILPG